jgi:hypothetical protein
MEENMSDGNQKNSSHMMAFIRHSITYVAVILVLLLINNLTWSGYQWWLWPAIGWGIGVIIHFLAVFVPILRGRFSGSRPGAGAQDQIGGLSPLEILGITLGSVAGLVVIIGLIVGAQMRPIGSPWQNEWWSRAELRASEWSARGESGIAGNLREEKDQTINGVQTIEIRTVAGSIDVVGGSDGGVGIHSVKTAPTQSAMRALEVGIEQRGSHLIINEKRADLIITRPGSISYTVTIPDGVTSIEAHSVSGSITVDNVKTAMEQKLQTVSGRIFTSRAADLHANTTSGEIRFDFEGDILEAGTVSGSIQGSITSMGENGTASLKTVSGSVDLEAFPALDASLALRSLSGHVSCDFPIVVSLQKNNALEGRIGAGNVPLSINTISGSINLHAR